jgi:hypothetical protein
MSHKRRKYATPNQDTVVFIDEWRPNYARKCEICDQTPCVQGWQLNVILNPETPPQDKLAYDGTMCGVCTWGEAACLDPENW